MDNLTEATRPTTLDQVVGHKAALADGGVLAGAAAGKFPNSIILVGPPGCGKTTIMRILTQGREHTTLNATESGVAAVRKAIASSNGGILVIDEIHRFSRVQQDALLAAVEAGQVHLLAATTENPTFALSPALRSRSHVVVLDPLLEEDVTHILEAATAKLQVNIDEEATQIIVKLAGGDGRRSVMLVEAGHKASQARGSDTITAQDLRAAWSGARGDTDTEYDLLSAYIKSIRGSDVDAALYYLARALHAGVKPEAVARRLVICASEDIGLADPHGLSVAVGAAHAVALVGMPEARINLAHATAYLAAAKKDNRAYQTVNAYWQDVETHPHRAVPDHLKDPHSTHIRAHAGYKNPHTDQAGEQQYLPHGAPRLWPG